MASWAGIKGQWGTVVDRHKDREIRIETGYGLEGVLTDALSSRINRNEIAPHFRQGNYDEGVKAGVVAIMQAIKGEYKNDEPPIRKKSSRRSPLGTLLILIIIIIIASRRGRGGRGGGGYWSSGSGWVGPMGGFGGSSGSVHGVREVTLEVVEALEAEDQVIHGK